MSSQRTLIRKNIAARLLAKYGPTGTVNQLIRQVQDAVWTPLNAPMTRISVQDAGQRRAGYRDSETTKSLATGIELNIDLPANWTKAYDGWVDFIQDLILDLQNWLPCAGALRCDYEDDDPISVALSNGTEVEVWVVHFRVTYFADVGEIGKS